MLLHQIKQGMGRRAVGVQDGCRADRHGEGERVAEAIGEEEFGSRQTAVTLLHAKNARAIEPRRLHETRVDVARALGHAGGA